MLNIDQELQQGRYRITKRFGQGKTISFYEAYDKILEKSILLKRTSVNFDENVSAVQFEARKIAFMNDAKFLAEIKHEGFLQVLENFSDIDSRYLVLELVDGKNIGEILKKEAKSFPLPDVVDWGKQMLDALEYLHQKNPPIVYYNLKPSNTHLSLQGKVKLLATGIDINANMTGSITKRSADPSTFNYSPLELIWENLDSASQRVILNDYDEKSEQILMQSPDVKSDLYSLGATLYHLITGKIPVDALERSIEIHEGNPDPLIAPDKLDSNLAFEISEVLMKSLEIRRENRFNSATEMREELESAYSRLRERKAQELRSQVPAKPVFPVRKPKPTEQKAQPVVLEVPAFESEESKQLEAIKQQLREAEEQKLLAEQRAAEAEKSLLEMKTQEFNLSEIAEISVNKDDSVDLTKSAESEEAITEQHIWEKAFMENSESEDAAFEKEFSTETSNNTNESFQTLFAQPQKENKFMKRIAIAAFGVLILVGGIFGVMKFLPQTSAELNPEIPSQTSVNPPSTAAEPQPNSETNSPAETEIAPQTNEAQTSGEIIEAKQNVRELPAKPEVSREKPAVPQIATSKTPAPPKPAVSAENEKKKVTVDDLINDTPNKKKVTVDDLIKDN